MMEDSQHLAQASDLLRLRACRTNVDWMGRLPLECCRNCQSLPSKQSYIPLGGRGRRGLTQREELTVSIRDGSIDPVCRMSGRSQEMCMGTVVFGGSIGVS